MARFKSILFPTESDAPDPVSEKAPYFVDLHLEEVIRSTVVGREEYELTPFFFTPLPAPMSVRYRHDVFRDLQRGEVSQCVRSFAEQMHRVRALLASATKLHERHFEQGWLLDAAEIYCGAVKALLDGLEGLRLASSGLKGFRDYLADYVPSECFRALDNEAGQLREDLAQVRYCAHVKGLRVTVTKYDGQTDYSVEIEDTFSKFRQGEVQDYRKRFPQRDTNYVMARVLECVARLYPEEFSALDRYFRHHRNFVDSTIERFDREVQLYLAYLDYIEPCRQAGLPFCYPEVSEGAEHVDVQDGFDLALASALVRKGESVVLNSVSLAAPERILVVTGPNQGGKTTFARMFGQVHYLASLGLPVPGRSAELSLADQIFTHFEKEEDPASLRGKLEDELVRVHAILEQATGRSLVIMNESFTSTSLEDALLLGTEVLKRVIEAGSLCVYVTFVDELAELSETTVSAVATVVPEDPAVRTYQVIRKPADGRAYALSLAEKHGLTYQQLKEVVAR